MTFFPSTSIYPHNNNFNGILPVTNCADPLTVKIYTRMPWWTSFFAI